jgi:hypothetical protein
MIGMTALAGLIGMTALADVIASAVPIVPARLTRLVGLAVRNGLAGLAVLTGLTALALLTQLAGRVRLARLVWPAPLTALVSGVTVAGPQSLSRRVRPASFPPAHLSLVVAHVALSFLGRGREQR